jgi:quercetin dioxygenase-like cupin family protein
LQFYVGAIAAACPEQNEFDHLICIKEGRPTVHKVRAMNEQPCIDVNQAKVLSLSQETQFAPNGIVSRTLLKTPYSRTVLFGFDAGQELTEHTSTQHALIQVLTGECDFSLAGQPQRLKAGDLLYMPPGMPHAVKAGTRFSMLLTLSRPA